jgi:NAD(P)-dependent dehydrogenase (short-subunit alcohol dehydrogenase family)
MTVQAETTSLTAVVTGATSGIGKAAALKLAADGFSVVVHGRDAERGAQVVAGIKASGGQARFVAADLSDASKIAGFADQVGDVDVLVNNAGIAWFGPTSDLEVATYDRLFAANVRSAYFLVAAVAPRMVARGTGNIINIGSMAGQVGMAGGAAYSATKAALASFTRSWAAEYSPAGVRVNTVSPGPRLHRRAASGGDRGNRHHDHFRPRRAGRGDRRGHLLPGLGQVELCHRRRLPSRRRPHRDLITHRSRNNGDNHLRDEL